MKVKEMPNGEYVITDDNGAVFHMTRTAVGFLVRDDVLGSTVLYSGTQREKSIIDDILKGKDDGLSLA